jgi:hypothetical protein
MNFSAIEIEIQELALAGLPEQDSERLRASVVAGLESLLSVSGLSDMAGLTNLSHLDAGRIVLAPGQTPEALGQSIAQSVYHSLGGQS